MVEIGITHLEVVAEWALLVEGRYEPEFRLEAVTSLFGAHELQNVVMIQLRQLENFLLRKPRLFVLHKTRNYTCYLPVTVALFHQLFLPEVERSWRRPFQFSIDLSRRHQIFLSLWFQSTGRGWRSAMAMGDEWPSVQWWATREKDDIDICTSWWRYPENEKYLVKIRHSLAAEHPISKEDHHGDGDYGNKSEHECVQHWFALWRRITCSYWKKGPRKSLPQTSGGRHLPRTGDSVGNGSQKNSLLQ